MKRLLASLLCLMTAGAWVLTGPHAWAVAAPAQIAPADGSTLSYPTDAPLFRWAAVPGAASYRIEVDDAPDFIGAISASTVNTAFTLTEPQTTGQSFYWHVQALSSTGKASAWSSTWSYQVSWPNSTPTLLSPTDGATITDVVLTWDPVPGAATYQVQVSPNGDWANNVVIDQLVKGTRFSPLQTLDNASYFWRVRARDAAATPNLGSWSSEWLFTRDWTGAPTLLTPADNLGADVTTPTFSWTPVAHSSDYELQVGDDVNFSPNTYSTCLTNHTTVTIYDTVSSSGPSTPGGCGGGPDGMHLQPGSVYYWRVRGVDEPAGANGLWSNTSAFTYQADTTANVPALTSPSDGDTVDTPVLSWQPVADTTKYLVTIKKPGGSTVSTTTAATSWTPLSDLASTGPFTWWVQTVDVYGRTGIIGEQRTFQTVSPTPVAAPPALLTPADASSSVRMPSMTWTAVTGASYYEVWYSVSGSGVEQRLSGTTKLFYPGFTYSGDPLAPGTYSWRVKAFDGTGTPVGTPSASRTFTIESAPDATYSGPCSTPQTPCTVKDTPTLSWPSVQDAGLYLVYVALDPNFTNIVSTYRTEFTTLTPRESYLDSQAGKAYYWFVRPCVTLTRCGPFNASVYPEAFAFRKVSKAVDLTSPSDGATVPNLVTFQWTDYLATNLADLATPTQEARQYRIQISTVADFASTLDTKTVDQTTFTPWAMTYPEGTLYWRVQAIDGSGNPLTWSPVRTVTKTSPKISLQEPAADVKLVGDLPYFRWTPQDYAARYELEVYRNGDLAFSPANRVISQQTKTSAWAPTNALPVGVYAWRLRRLDADSRPGPWSLGRRFTIAKAPTTTTLTVSKVSGRIKAAGSVTPLLPGEKMSVALFRKQNGSFKKLATKTPTIGSTGHYVAKFRRPAVGTCKITASYPGDPFHKKSSATKTFNC